LTRKRETSASLSGRGFELMLNYEFWMGMMDDV